MQAETGIMSVTGEPDGVPTRLGLSMIDFMTGITGAVGLLAAILKARTRGVGAIRHWDTSRPSNTKGSFMSLHDSPKP